MANDQVFKKLDRNRDVLYLQTVERQGLFYPENGVFKSYETSETTITTSSQPSENPNYYVEVGTVRRNTTDDIALFSYAQGQKATDINTASSDSYMYYEMKQMLKPESNELEIIDGVTVDKFDLMAVSREFYKDKIDPNYFSVFINTEASNPTTAPTDFSISSNILGLYPSQTERESKIGRKRMLYPTTSTETLYDPSTDELTVVSESELDKTTPYGVVYLDAGIVMLFTGKIQADYPNVDDTTTLHFMAGIVGRSEIQLNSVLYYLRVLNQDFNYTTNPTFYEDVDDNIIKEKFRDEPTTFITTVGLYNDNNDLISVGKLSKPIQNNFENESIIHAQLSI